MSILDDLKAAWNKEYNESEEPADKIATLFVAVVFGLFFGFIVVLLLSLVWMMMKEAFPIIAIGLLIYGLGAYFQGWPLPSFLKKFIK